MQACLAGLSKAQTQKKLPSDGGQDYELSLEDVVFLQDLAKRDEFIRKLAASSEGLEILGKVLELTATGPVKIAVQWNLGLIEGWSKANASLAKINKSQVCDLIVERSMETKAIKYFDALYEARGCR